MFQENRLAYLATKTTSKTASKSSGLSSIARSIASAASKAKTTTAAKTTTTTKPKTTSGVTSIAKNIAGTAGAAAASKAVSSTFSAPKTSGVTSIAKSISNTASEVKASQPKTTTKSSGSSKSSKSSSSSKSSGSSSKSSGSSSKSSSTKSSTPATPVAPVEETEVLETPIETEEEALKLPPAIEQQVQEEEAFEDKWTDETEKLKKAQINAEADYAEVVEDAARAKYEAEQKRLEEMMKIQKEVLDAKNQAAISAAEVERRDADALYQASKNDTEIQRERAAKAYQDQLVEQKVANTKRTLQMESALAAMGGFGSLAKNKEMLDLTLSNDRLVNSIVFEKETTNKEYTFELNDLAQNYQNDLYRIEANKAAAIQDNYNTYLQYVTDIQADMEMSEIEKYEAVTTAKAEYKKNVAQINQDAFVTRYELAKNAKDAIYNLKFRQVDPNVSSIVGFAADANGNAILDEDGNKIKVASSTKPEVIKDMWGNPSGYFDYDTKTFVPFGETDSFVLPTGGSYEITPVGNGIRVGVEENTYAGQCGRFVNDVIGTRIIKDSKQSKLDLIDESITAPTAGMVFVQDVGTYGHVGIVEKVNNNGTMQIVESNGDGVSEMIRRRTINVSDVNGFFIPPGAQSMTSSLSSTPNFADAGFQNYLTKQGVDLSKMTTAQAQMAWQQYQGGVQAGDNPEPTEMGKQAGKIAGELYTMIMEGKGTSLVGGTRNLLYGQIASLFTGTDAANLKSKYQKLANKLSVDSASLIKGQGQISDGERRMLTEAANELDIGNQGTLEFVDALETIMVRLKQPIQFSKANPYYDLINELPQEITMNEIQSYLDQGYTSKQIYEQLKSL